MVEMVIFFLKTPLRPIVWSSLDKGLVEKAQIFLVDESITLRDASIATLQNLPAGLESGALRRG